MYIRFFFPLSTTRTVKRVSDRLMVMKLEVKRSSAYAPQVGNSMEKNEFWQYLRLVDSKCIKTREDSVRCGSKWTCWKRKHRR